MDRTFDSRRLLGTGATGIALVGAAAILFMAGAIVIDVVMRAVFNAPILGVDDLGRYNLAVIVASFFPVCLVGGHFVTIRFLGRALGMRGGLWLEVVGAVATLCVFVLLAWQFFRFTLFDVTMTGLDTPVLELPQAPWWWVVTTIIILCVPVQFVVLWESVVRAMRGEPRETGGNVDAGV